MHGMHLGSSVHTLVSAVYVSTYTTVSPIGDPWASDLGNYGVPHVAIGDAVAVADPCPSTAGEDLHSSKVHWVALRSWGACHVYCNQPHVPFGAGRSPSWSTPCKRLCMAESKTCACGGVVKDVCMKMEAALATASFRRSPRAMAQHVSCLKHWVD